MSMIASDLANILSDTAFFRAVSCGLASTRGNLSTSSVLHSTDGGQVQVRVTTLVIRAGTLPTASVGSTVVVDGTSYRVDQIAPETGGATQRFYLARTP